MDSAVLYASDIPSVMVSGGQSVAILKDKQKAAVVMYLRFIRFLVCLTVSEFLPEI